MVLYGLLMWEDHKTRTGHHWIVVTDCGNRVPVAKGMQLSVRRGRSLFPVVLTAEVAVCDAKGNKTRMTQWITDNSDFILSTETRVKLLSHKVVNGKIRRVASNSIPVSLRMKPDVYSEIRKEADRRGLPYQTFINFLLSQAVDSNFSPPAIPIGALIRRKEKVPA